MTKDDILFLMKDCGFMLTDVPPEPYVKAMTKFAERVIQYNEGKLFDNTTQLQIAYAQGLEHGRNQMIDKVQGLELQLKAYRARIEELVNPKRSAFDTLPDDYETGDY